MSVIRNFIDKPVIKVLTGMRRCGKSSLLILTYEEIQNASVLMKSTFCILTLNL